MLQILLDFSPPSLVPSDTRHFPWCRGRNVVDWYLLQDSWSLQSPGLPTSVESCILSTTKVKKQDFLQVFQGSGIGKIGDNLTSADPLSYTITIMIPGRPGKLRLQWASLDLQKPTPQLPVEPRITVKHWTGRQVSNSSSNYPPKTIEEGVWPLPSYTATNNHFHS